MWLDTKPLTKVARHRTQSRVAGMGLVVLVAVEIRFGQSQTRYQTRLFIPGSGTSLRARIRFPARKCHSLEGAWLAILCISKEDRSSQFHIVLYHTCVPAPSTGAHPPDVREPSGCQVPVARDNLNSSLSCTHLSNLAFQIVCKARHTNGH